MKAAPDLGLADADAIHTDRAGADLTVVAREEAAEPAGVTSARRSSSYWTRKPAMGMA